MNQQLQMTPKPDKVSVEEKADGLVFRYRWFEWSNLFTVIFFPVWGVLIFGGSTRFFKSFDSIIPFVFLTFAIVAAYSALAGLLNVSTIKVNHETMVVRYGPLPWLGGKTVRVADIRQLYVEAAERSNRGSNWKSFRLCGIDINGNKVDLDKRIKSADVGFYMEQEIEKFLGIADQPVKGEYRGR